MTTPFFVGGGQMGELMRSTDWSKTGLGPVDTWPRSLKTMLGVILGSRFPMLLWWGPDLLHLYNDAYRPILRDKHPASLAAPAAQVWAEVWDVAGPMARSVQNGGPATWTEDLQLFINSGTITEETYFTFSYSPVPGDDGGIGGLLNTVQETTAKVQGERQIRMLHDLGTRTAVARSEDDAYRVVAEVLSANELDVPFALLYALDEQHADARLVGVSRWHAYEGPAKPAHIPLGERIGSAAWPIAEVAASAREMLVDDLAARFGSLPVGTWQATPARAILLPISRVGQATPCAVLIAGISPHRTFDARYQRFFHAMADQITTVIATARTYATEKKRSEMLTEIDRAKTTFFNNVSHEFRTPLTLILGPIEDALADPVALPAAQRDRLMLVQRNGQRLLRLVNALLDFARIEAGRMHATYLATDLAKATTEMASMFDSALAKAGLRLVVDCPPLPELAWIDREMWEKIVLNLISNAFKFTVAGEIAVRLRHIDGRFELRISDTGVGIPAEELPHMFERFHRVAGTQGRTIEGSGIGLSLVAELVRLHGGSVAVESTQGIGSTFIVSLPRGHAHLPADAISSGDAMPDATRGLAGLRDEIERSAAPPPLASEAKPSTTASGRIVLAEDNPDLREFTVAILAPYYQVEAVGDGEAALAAITRAPPDLVLSDIMMPRLDGIGLLQRLRADPATRTVPVILLSARAGEEATVAGLDASAEDYLSKPFSSRELLARVRTHLAMTRTRRAWAEELQCANQELESFSYTVSHDLRAPLRSIDGFSKALLDTVGTHLDQDGRHYLDRIRASTRRMSQLIDDLLGLARITRAPLRRVPVDMSSLARRILSELAERQPERRVAMTVADGVTAYGDLGLLTAVLENLLGNAWKFTARQSEARISFEYIRGDETVFSVRDNGAGFDMAHVHQLFTPFQRLHREAEFPGTGIGLATVRRIIARHGGRIWAEAVPNVGAAFSFTLGDGQAAVSSDGS